MVDELHSRERFRGARVQAGPASARSAHSALIQSLQSLRERVLERLDSLETLARQRIGVRPPAAGESHGPGTDPSSRNRPSSRRPSGRLRRPGRAPGEGVERVADPTRGGSPLARRSLGTRRASNASTYSSASETHPHSHAPSPGPAAGVPRPRCRRRRRGPGPIRRGRFRRESPDRPGDPPTIPNPLQRRSAQRRGAPRFSIEKGRRPES